MHRRDGGLKNILEPARKVLVAVGGEIQAVQFLAGAVALGGRAAFSAIRFVAFR
jgi:hypothetical protein